MAEEWHAPYEHLTRETITRHQALRSLMEELEAIDWYRQRADDCTDEQLKAILLHNMREEIEHAMMVLEWLRRTDADFARNVATYINSTGDITEVEEEIKAGGGLSEPSRVEHASGGEARELPKHGFTIGSLKRGAPWTP